MKKILFASILSAYSVFAAEPILKVGIISDTHIKRNITSCKNLEAALRLFKAHKVDMIVNTGDIAEVYQNQAYINYRNTVKKVYTAADKQPQEIFVFAWHDRVRREKEPQEKVYADIKKLLEIKHEMYETFKIKDYTFLLFPQQVNWKRYQNTVAEACRNNPGKPVFIIDHVPPYNTVYDSMTWGNKNCRKVLDKYPQVIHLSGHVHGTLTNQLNIWQGNFTAVNAGSLASWNGALVGNAPISMLTDTAMIMEIYTDKVVFRRFFSASQKEYQADARWIVPLPFDKKNAPYNFEHRKSNDTAPEFAKDAKLNIKVTSSNIKLTFPQATHKNGVFTYKIMLYLQKNGKWVNYSRKDIFGNFMYEGKKRIQSVQHSLSTGYFDKGKNYCIKVIPVGFFGLEGKPLNAEFKMETAGKSTVVFESSDPMKDCPFLSGLSAGKPLAIDADGFYEHNVSNARLVFPDKIWNGQKGTKFRLTFDVHMKQSNERGWTLVMRNPTPMHNATARIQTPPGNSGIFRYVIDFKKQGSDYKYYLLIREGLKGKIHFHYAKIERID